VWSPARLALLIMVCTTAPLLAVATGCGSGRQESETHAPNSAQSQAADVTTGPIAFAHCMRRHGVHNFPEPEASGHIPQPSARVKSLPGFARAQKACAKYAEETEPNEMTAAGRAEVTHAMQAFALCMRRHGVNMSDPIIGANSMSVHLPAGMSPGDPAVKQAKKKCAAAEARVFTLIGRFPGDPGTVPRKDY
jgi:hypothetical protein